MVAYPSGAIEILEGRGVYREDTSRKKCGIHIHPELQEVSPQFIS
jgi:hypothetical protein